MTRANSQVLAWPPPTDEHDAQSVDTLAVYPGEFLCIIRTLDATEDISLNEAQIRKYGVVGEKLLDEVVDKIRRLAPLEVHGETQRLLDAAIENQETGLCDDLEGWASRLADDVKDAGD